VNAPRPRPVPTARGIAVYLSSPTGRALVDDYPLDAHVEADAEERALAAAHALADRLAPRLARFRVEVVNARTGRSIYSYSQVGPTKEVR
jgi:hypothetical protein